MKVLMAPVNIAGQPVTVMNELRRQGVDVSLLQYTTTDEGHSFGYPGDKFVNIRGRHRVEAQTETLESALAGGYDIFHFWMSTLFGGRRYSNMYGFDLPFIKARGRRIVYRGTGFDLRVQSEHIARNPHHPFQHGYILEIDEELQRLYLDYLKSYVDLFIVQDPEMREFMPQARVVPRGLDLEAFAPVGIEPTDRPLVVHAPSKTLVKGTPIVLDALKELAQEGLPFEFKLITGMPHQEAMSWYRRADLIIDQLLIGWYGVLTVEALALGKPVVVYVRDDLYERFSPRIPIANANPDTLKDVLRPLITDYEARRALAQDGPDYVREVHDVRKIATSLREIYDEVMEMPVSQPDTYDDLNFFVAQFKDVEALEERRTFRFKSRKYDELLAQLPKLRFRANKYDELLTEVKRLRRRIGELEAQAAGALAEGAPATVEATPDPDKVTIDRGVLRSLRAKAQELDQLSHDLPRLRYQARRGEELFEEVKSLRYKTANFDALRDEVLALRYKLKQSEAQTPS